MAAIVVSAISAVSVILPARGAQLYTPRWMSNPFEICVERPEETGRVNITPVTVIFAAETTLTLVGGEAGCVFLRDGPRTISLSFPYPYAGVHDRRIATVVHRFEAMPGSVVRFELCEAADVDTNAPGWATQGWRDMWLLSQQGEQSKRHCASRNGS